MKEMVMAKKYIVSLGEGEQNELKTVIGKRSEKAQVVKRAYILLTADENGNVFVTARLRCAIKSRFALLKGCASVL